MTSTPNTHIRTAIIFFEILTNKMIRFIHRKISKANFISIVYIKFTTRYKIALFPYVHIDKFFQFIHS